MMSIDLAGRSAVVTGGASGIGKAIAAAMAHAGASVAILDLADEDDAAAAVNEVAGHGVPVRYGRGDTGDPDQVEKFAAQIEQDWGGIDIWVNNAARLVQGDFLDLPADTWRSLVETNLLGYFHGCRSAVARMRRQGRGRIVNISSVTFTQPTSTMTAYISSKGGIVGLTRSLAVEVGGEGITVNSIAPGAIETPLTSAAYTPQVRAAYERRIPAGRVGVAADIAGAAVFLASDLAAYVTGAELIVDGGLHLNGNIDL